MIDGVTETARDLGCAAYRVGVLDLLLTELLGGTREDLGAIRNGADVVRRVRLAWVGA